MHLLKLALIAVAVALFALACNNASNTADKPSDSQGKSSIPPAVADQLAAANTHARIDTANAAPADELAGARQIYGERCTKCHGANADGGRVEFDDIKLKVPGLREGRVRNLTNDQLARRIGKGGDGMPAFKDKLSAEEINSLARLIKHDFQGQSAAPTNAPVAPPSR
jgi:cytochrome c551